MGNGLRTLGRTSILILNVDATWTDATGISYTCSSGIAGGVGFDSCNDPTAICGANTYVNPNNLCACVTTAQGASSTYISDGPSNVVFAGSTDTCVDCNVITSNTVAYNGYAATNFFTGTSSNCACLNTQFRPTGGKCSCQNGSSALASTDPGNDATDFVCVQCSDIVSGVGANSGSCGCSSLTGFSTADCNDDNSCAQNAIINAGTNVCECRSGYTETIDNKCLACGSLQAYSLATNPLRDQSGSCTSPCSSLDKKPDTSGICQCPSGKAMSASTWDATDATIVTAYDCISCTAVISGPGSNDCTSGGSACASNAIPDSSGVCTCYTDPTTSIKYLESLDGASCVSCATIGTPSAPDSDLLDSTGNSACKCKTYAKPDTANNNVCTCSSGYTKGGSFDANNAVTSYMCIPCSTINSGPGFSVADCNAGTSNGCATNAVPDVDNAGVCRCIAGYLKSLDGNSCVACSSVGSNSLIDTATSSCTQPCVTYAAPDTSNSNLCTCQSGTTESHEYWDADNKRACIAYASLTGVGADTSTGKCGLLAYLKETGQCSCLDSTATLPIGTSTTYSTGADFCYRSNTAPECVKDAASGTIGLLYTTCTTSGLTLTLNEACRSADYSRLQSTLFYVGSDSTTCKFTLSGSNYVIDSTTLDITGFTLPCGMTKNDDGTHTTYTATVNYDNTGLDYGVTAGTTTCKIENANPSNIVTTQISGWQFDFPDFSSVIDAYDKTTGSMSSIVTMTGPTSTTVNLGDLITISISEVIANVFAYRIEKTWISTSQTLTDFSAGTDPKFLLVNNGCPTVPCWGEIKNSGTTFEFRAVRFASSTSIYIFTEIYLCQFGTNCQATGCDTCSASYSGYNNYTPSGRKRRNVPSGQKPVIVRQEVKFDKPNMRELRRRSKRIEAPYGATLIVSEDMADERMLTYTEHTKYDTI